MKLLDFGKLVRYLYPGVIIAIFAWFTMQQYLQGISDTVQKVLLLPIIFLIGLVIHPIYRIALWLPTRCFLAKIGWIPQYEFHKQVVETLQSQGRQFHKRIKTVTKASACAAYVLTYYAKPEFYQQLSDYNSSVHLLYLTAFISIGAYFYSLFALSQSWIWLIIFSLSYLFGILIDHFILDELEVTFLRRHKDKYIDVLLSIGR